MEMNNRKTTATTNFAWTRSPRPVRGSALIAVAAILLVPRVAWSQLSGDSAVPPAPRSAAEDEEAARREIERLRLLIVPQQKERARQWIEQHPGTELARVAREVLDRYAQFEQLKARELARTEAHESLIRGYWDARRPRFESPPPVDFVLRNDSNVPVLYELRTPITAWLGPHRMAVGGTYRAGRPVEIRFVGARGLTQVVLLPGRVYAFADAGEGEITLHAR